MIIPGPMEYLKSHVIAFVAGAITVILANAYVRYEARQSEGNTNRHPDC